jgi:galactose mutarotase-like enzyme
MTTTFETTHSGFRVLGLRSSEIELCCAPALGGRVFSLVNRRTGREWLWRQQAGRELFYPDNPHDFGTGTFAGLDECLPTVGAGTWSDGQALADHGDIWARAWDVDEHSGTTIALTVEIPSFGLRFTRGCRIEGSVVRFDYTLENHGPMAAPALWAMHPLFTLAEGDRLELPEGVSELHLGSVHPALPGKTPNTPVITFPEPVPGVRLDELKLPDLCSGYLKCFTAALPAGSACAALINPQSGDRFEVCWDTATIPYLGLWLTRGGYRGWHHVALEPTNAPHDQVTVAAADPRFAPAVMLSPGARRNWWVEWRLS